MFHIKDKLEKLLSKLIQLPPDDDNSFYEKKFNKLNNALDIINIDNDDKQAFQLNIYLKMFIHELRTPLSTISMGLNILKNFIGNKNNDTTVM